jgi:hypothetical protein
MDDIRTKATGELVREVADDLQMLVRKELELARVELLDGLKAQLKGAGLIAFAGAASLPGLLFLVIALALWLPFSAAAGFVIVGGGISGLATALHLRDRARPAYKGNGPSPSDPWIVRWLVAVPRTTTR